MSLIFWSLSILSLLALYHTVAMRSLCAGLTVRYTWYWAVASTAVFCVSTILCGPVFHDTSGWLSGLQCLSAVMLLTPSVCTLGARRPGVAAWQWFVVLPLVFVLAWPGLIQIATSHGRGTVQLSGPAIIGFAVVTLMSASPGLSRTMTLPTLLHLLTVLLTLWPLTGWPWFPIPASLFAPVPLLASKVLANRQLRSRLAQISASASAADRLNEVWGFIQDFYGVVWPQRIMERMRQFEQAEKWRCRLTEDGFQKHDASELTHADLVKPVESFRWVLQRFADADWIDRYVPAIAPGNSSWPKP